MPKHSPQNMKKKFTIVILYMTAHYLTMLPALKSLSQPTNDNSPKAFSAISIIPRLSIPLKYPQACTTRLYRSR